MRRYATLRSGYGKVLIHGEGLFIQMAAAIWKTLAPPTPRLTPGRAGRLLAVLALSGGVLWLAYDWSERLFLEETRQRARATLELHARGLEGALRKYEVIPELLAGQAEIIALFRDRADPGSITRANRLTEEANRASGAEDTYFMNSDGVTFAASNWAGERPFVGRDFSFRPYFQQAMQGRLGRYFALGTTSNKRGYYFAYPVTSAGRIEGAVVVKMNVDRIESSLVSGNDEVIVTDPHGVIFLSSKPEWRFRTLQPLSAETILQIERYRQYPLEELTPLDLEEAAAPNPDFDLVRIAGAAGEPVEYLVQSKDMSEANWTIHILADTRWARSQVTTTVALSLLACLLALMLVAAVDQRRRRLLERIEIQKTAAERLEQRVRERTSDLSQANRLLEQEINERKTTEAALRRTQDELVQAGKLAALGQMSAAISHEFNQPLAAVRSYAENAVNLISRGRDSEASDNCSRIHALTGRMAEISKHLNAFARKPRSQTVPVSLGAVVEDTLQLLRSRIEAAGVEVKVEKPDELPYVLAGPVRLQQVVTNLVINALDAMAQGSGAMVEITLQRDGDALCLGVRDHGPGIAERDLPRIFDPFFTTKEVGHGLGLGLSISYNIVKDFNGSLVAENHESGGAIFTVRLPLAPATNTPED